MKEIRKKVLLIVCLCFIFFCFGITINASEEMETQKSFPYNIAIDLITYSGNYSGETKNGIPEGDGRFATDEESPKQFVYEGEFEDGVFSGKGVVTYGDIIFECEFRDGTPRGNSKIIYSDYSYVKVRYRSGIPTEAAMIYSADEKYQGYDFYYEGESIKKLKDIAISFDYKDLFLNEQELFGDVLKLEGIVEKVYELPEYRILKIADKAGNIYWSKYKNTVYSIYDQAIMPQVEEGENIVLYGFFQGLGMASLFANIGDEKFPVSIDDEDAGYMFPRIAPITAEVENGISVNREKPSFNYKEVCRFPYDYYNLRNTLKGRVENIIYRSSTSYYLKFISENNNVYYILLDTEDITYTPVPGDNITVRSVYKGLYKILDYSTGLCSGVYPNLSATSIKVNR